MDTMEKEKTGIDEIAKPVVKKTRKGTKKSVKKEVLRGTVYRCRLLNVRAGCSMDSKILGTIPSGKVVEIDREKSSDGFYHVTTEDGTVGFCKEDYIDTENVKG